MADTTKIEWTDATFNPWIGCTKVSPGCDNCYAAQQDKFRRWTPQGWGGPRKRTSEANWRKPTTWNDTPFYECRECSWRGETDSNCPSCAAEVQTARRRVFCASLADVFDNAVPEQWRADLFALICQTPHLDWLLLSKRIGNAASMLDRIAYLGSTDTVLERMPLPNVWIGATVVNQEEADRDIPKLAAVPARVRFLSIEPLLGPVDLRLVTKTWAPGRCNHCCNGDRCDDPSHYDRRSCPHCHGTGGTPIKWVIVGGESGPKARPMHPDWARSLRDQCAAAGVPFLFKQWGEWTPGENVERVRGTVDTAFLWDDRWSIYPLNLATDHGHIDDQPDLYRVGKKAAGRLLDGAEHNGFPA